MTVYQDILTDTLNKIEAIITTTNTNNGSHHEKFLVEKGMEKGKTK